MHLEWRLISSDYFRLAGPAPCCATTSVTTAPPAFPWMCSRLTGQVRKNICLCHGESSLAEIRMSLVRKSHRILPRLRAVRVVQPTYLAIFRQARPHLRSSATPSCYEPHHWNLSQG